MNENLEGLKKEKIISSVEALQISILADCATLIKPNGEFDEKHKHHTRQIIFDEESELTKITEQTKNT